MSEIKKVVLEILEVGVIVLLDDTVIVLDESGHAVFVDESAGAEDLEDLPHVGHVRYVDRKVIHLS